MGGTGHAARIVEIKMHIRFRTENLKGRDNLENLDVDGKIILEWILGK
jgi:hypothetical protein